MRTLSTSCRNCGIAMQIEIEDSTYFTDQGLCEMATCDRCFDAIQRIEKIGSRKPKPEVEREVREYKKPYKD